MAEYIGLRFPLDADLKLFSQFLWQRRIPHRVAEEQGDQVLWVGSEAHAALVKELYERLERGEFQLVDEPQLSQASLSFSKKLLSSPLVCLLLLLSALGAVLPWLDSNLEMLSRLSFYPLSPAMGQVQAVWPLAQPWRVITPIFLHFGLLHIAFNGLWLWVLGGMIELRQGSVRVLGIVILVGGASNIAQAMVSVALFGGMSGVIYGLLGYIVAWNRLRPAQQFPLQPALAWLMIGWLLLCMVGFARILGLGDIANTAHFSGLLMGLLLGVVAALVDSRPG